MIVEPNNRFLYTATAFAKRIILMKRSLRLKTVRLEGTTRCEKSHFTLYYIGERETLGQLKAFYFDKIFSEKVYPVPLLTLGKKIEHLSSINTVIIVEINRLLDSYIPKGWFHTFPWIKQIVRAVDNNFFGERKAKIEDTYGRKIRQYEYSYKITKDKDAVKKFYYELYVPYVSNRYQENTHVRSFFEIYSGVKSGFLLQIFDQDKWVSGLACGRNKKTVKSLAGGLNQDYQYYLKRGARSACYYFLFKWAQENAIETIDLLRSRPNLCDGVYEYKRMWRAIPEKDVWPHTSLWIYVPNRLRIPKILQKQLIWHGQKFVTLGGIINDNSEQ